MFAPAREVKNFSVNPTGTSSSSSPETSREQIARGRESNGQVGRGGIVERRANPGGSPRVLYISHICVQKSDLSVYVSEN